MKRTKLCFFFAEQTKLWCRLFVSFFFFKTPWNCGDFIDSTIHSMYTIPHVDTIRYNEYIYRQKNACKRHQKNSIFGPRCPEFYYDYFIYLFYHSGIVTFNYDCAALKSQTISMWYWLWPIELNRTNNKCESILVTTKTYLNWFEMANSEWISLSSSLLLFLLFSTTPLLCSVAKYQHSPKVLLTTVVVAIHLWCHRLNISRWFQFQLIQTTACHALPCH